MCGKWSRIFEERPHADFRPAEMSTSGVACVDLPRACHTCHDERVSPVQRRYGLVIYLSRASLACCPPVAGPVACLGHQGGAVRGRLASSASRPLPVVELVEGCASGAGADL